MLFNGRNALSVFVLFIALGVSFCFLVLANFMLHSYVLLLTQFLDGFLSFLTKLHYIGEPKIR